LAEALQKRAEPSTSAASTEVVAAVEVVTHLSPKVLEILLQRGEILLCGREVPSLQVCAQLAEGLTDWNRGGDR